MLKKEQVLSTLEAGGHIMIDSIYRTATVYDENGERLDSCRYDTAERIEKSDGYTRRKTDWHATWFIEKDWNAASEAVKEAVTDALRVFETAGVISDLKIEPLTAAQVEEITARTAAQEEEQEEQQPAKDTRTPHERVIARDPDNKNAWRLPGYPGPLWRLCYTRGGYCTAYFPSKREMQDALEELRKHGGYDFKAAHRANSASEWEEIPAETHQEETDRENRDHCRYIAETLDRYASGELYKCPHCGEIHGMDEYEETEHENEDGYTCYTCPNCGEEIEEDDLEAVSLYDYFTDCYDIEYRCGSDREYRSVCIMVACGGPNIYIDTASKNVELYWWTDRAHWPISYKAVEAVDAWAEEYWSCL